MLGNTQRKVVCDTAKVRFFKQITTMGRLRACTCGCLRYCKSTIFQANHNLDCGNTAHSLLFAILQKYDFSSKSQPALPTLPSNISCLRYCKSTIFQANHNTMWTRMLKRLVVCDTAKVRFFKQITTAPFHYKANSQLFAILQKYDFSSKSQPAEAVAEGATRCLRYCKSTIFQANHNQTQGDVLKVLVVCDTAKVRFFKQITTSPKYNCIIICCLRYCKSTIFQANHNGVKVGFLNTSVVCDTAKVRFFKQITTERK